MGHEYSSKVQRETFLKDNCEKVEEKGYMKPFTEDQIKSNMDNLAALSIQIEDINTEKKASAEYFKDRLKPLEEKRKTTISNIKTKAEYVREICYKFVDQANREVGYYNSDGDLIETRAATMDEMQPTLFMHKTGTND